MISWRNTGAVKDSTRSASCGNNEYTRALSVLGPCPKKKLSLAFPCPKAKGPWVEGSFRTQMSKGLEGKGLLGPVDPKVSEVPRV